MGIIRGNPVALVALFFGAAVVLIGGIYSLFPIASSEQTPVLIVALLVLGALLVLTMAILSRIIWLTTKSSFRRKATKIEKKT